MVEVHPLVSNSVGSIEAVKYIKGIVPFIFKVKATKEIVNTITEYFAKSVEVKESFPTYESLYKFLTTYININSFNGISKEYPRGSGQTTFQMKTAPYESVFLSSNNEINYLTDLARFISREDLLIKTPNWLTSYRWKGKKYSGIVLDHALHIDSHLDMHLKVLTTQQKRYKVYD